MKNSFFITVAFVLSANSALAEVKIISPLTVEKDVPAWNAAYTEKMMDMIAQEKVPKTGYMECAPTRELPNAFLCLSYKQKDMNLTFNRITGFVEGFEGLPKGEVVPHSDPTLQGTYTSIGGHDLQKSAIMEFLRKAQGNCKSSGRGAEMCLNAHEKEIFTKLILPHFYQKKNENLVVITYSLNTQSSYRDVVSHEILHAQFFLSSDFQDITTRFWKEEVSETDKAQIRRLLSLYYNDKDEFLMLNEFQAYILMAGAEENLLAMFVDKYRPKLLRDLATKKLRPIQVP
ncbi:MAG: hypothetical protein K2X47_17970 [Bdellovibrionales bacterium]|nr:hypothetical protein [Bdellovibrionales bacterium]